MHSKRLVAGIYLFITAICVSVSTYVTIVGFWTLLKVLAIPIGLAIGAALFLSDFLIKQRLERGQRIWRAVVMLLFAMTASWASHFNYFYTNAISDQAVLARMQSAHDRYASNLADALVRLDALPSYRSAAERELLIREEFPKLRSEALDRRQPGIGPEAEEHIAEISRLLGVSDANIVRPPIGSPPEEVEQWINEYEARVVAQLRLVQSADPVVVARADVAARQTASSRDLQEGLQGDAARQRQLIEQWERETATLNVSVTYALRFANVLPMDQAVQYQSITSSGTELGEIMYSLYDGFVARTDFNVTIFATLASILIDILPLMVGIFLLGRRKTPIEDEEDESYLDPRDPSADIENITG